MREAFKLQSLIREIVLPIVVFILIDLVLTFVFLDYSSPAVHVGTLRPIDEIPLKVFALVLAGLGVGLAATLVTRKFDASLVVLAVAFTALLDIDHLPSFFGIAQPIRPAHSIAFLAITFVAITLVSKRRYDVSLIFLASFFAHMASDTGVFAIFAPISFSYFSMIDYRVPLAIGSLFFALLSGYLKRKRNLTSSKRVMVEGVMNRK